MVTCEDKKIVCLLESSRLKAGSPMAQSCRYRLGLARGRFNSLSQLSQSIKASSDCQRAFARLRLRCCLHLQIVMWRIFHS